MLKAFKDQFQKYTKNFYSDDPEYNKNIALKAAHCIRVARLCADIARREGFCEQDQMLAQIIGLVHDIGRFEQYRRFQTFSDHLSLNHGVLGADVLEKHFTFKDLDKSEKNLILKTTRFHNAARLPHGESPRLLALLRLVRDADKIDIFRLSYDYFRQRTAVNKNTALELHTTDDEHINDKIYDCIMAGQQALKKDIRTLNDFKALQISWIFDIHYQRSFEMIFQRQYRQKISRTFSDGHARALCIFQKAAGFLEARVRAYSGCAPA